MKLPIIFLLSLCSFYCGVIANSNKVIGDCIKQDYELGAQKDLEKRFEDGFSISNYFTSYITLKLFNVKLWKFCACALYKRSELKSKTEGTDIRPFEEIAQVTERITQGDINVNVFYLNWFNKANFIQCKSDQEACVIVRGFRQKAYTEPIYDIFVGIQELDPQNPKKKVVIFQGVIKNVNMAHPPN